MKSEVLVGQNAKISWNKKGIPSAVSATEATEKSDSAVSHPLVEMWGVPENSDKLCVTMDTFEDTTVFAVLETIFLSMKFKFPKVRN